MKTPTYGSKAHALMTDPASQKIRGCIIEIRGYPFVGKKIADGLRPKYYFVDTIKAGK